ncbi:hypothetical protein [Kordia sp.]
MKTTPFKPLKIRRSTISNLQVASVEAAKSWGHSCFTSLKNQL